ncbi:hypothetical protein G6L28_13745 [Agrobacterium larrymoorei]|uniref:hypothetical protein n=1 Tax=Agrobacterium larrymoorei TaxID=160699 RepID=UPI0015725398|nr:hypothetical protein [Agrobacterium larrymoorei]NTJ43663.1 hypothetical protein [Agrobacterium larrymoorei]
MQSEAKSLYDMDFNERTAMFDTVSEALDNAADHAFELGEFRLVDNFRSVSSMLQGEAGKLATQDLRSMEMLLRQAVTLLQLYMERPEQRPLLH